MNFASRLCSLAVLALGIVPSFAATAQPALKI